MPQRLQGSFYVNNVTQEVAEALKLNMQAYYVIHQFHAPTQRDSCTRIQERKSPGMTVTWSKFATIAAAWGTQSAAKIWNLMSVHGQNHVINRIEHVGCNQ